MIRSSRALMGLGLVLVAGGPAVMAQSRFRIADPYAVSGNGGGWNVSANTGSLAFRIPVAAVQGEIPIPLLYRYDASFALTKTMTPKGIYNPDGSFTQTGWTTKYRGNPIWGTLHFGYIGSSSTSGGTTIPESTILEDGTQYMAGDWVPWTTTTMGSTLSLPQAFGLAAKATSAVQVTTDATHLSYTTSTASDLGTWQATVQGLMPTTFGTLNATWRVVADKDLARVYVYLPDFSAWVPLLWVDRFGHSVQFQWTKSTASMPAGITAIYSVKALNQRNQGVQIQWANYAASVTTAQDLVRADFVNVTAPSIVIIGYPGTATATPSGMSFSGSFTAPTPYIPGSIGRPTSIQVGPSSQIKVPSWQGSGQPLPIPPGATSGPLLQWSFTYDANNAELTGFTDAMGVQTSFSYQSYQFGYPTATGGSHQFRGVSQVDAVDPKGGKDLRQTWSRNLPLAESSTYDIPSWVVTAKRWEFATGTPTTPDRYVTYTFAPSTDPVNFGNGALMGIQLLQTDGTVLATGSYAQSAVGIDGSLSLPTTMSQTRQGELQTTSSSTSSANTAGLQVGSSSFNAYDSSGAMHYMAGTSSTYDTRWDLLDIHRPTQVKTYRYDATGTTPLAPVLTSQTTYDTNGLPTKATAFGAATLTGTGTVYSGQTFTFSGGKPSSVATLLLDNSGNTIGSAPLSVAYGYDSASGQLSSKTTTYADPAGTGTLTQTASNFDDQGRPLTITDSNGVSTNLTYDLLGRVTKLSRSGEPDVTLSYPDLFTTVTTRGGVTTTEVRDGFGRMTSRTLPNQLTQAYTYDQYGRLIRMDETTVGGASRNSTTTYDGLDRVLSTKGVKDVLVTYAYSTSGLTNVVTETLVGPNLSTKTYTDPFGQMVRVEDPFGTVTTTTYDGQGNPLSVTTTDSTGKVQSRTFQYDALGRLTQKQEPETGTQTFGGFNHLGQPTTFTEAYGTADARTQTLGYDGTGRLRSMANGTTSTSYTYQGALLTSSSSTAADGTVVTQGYTYGGPGSRLSKETLTLPGFVVSTQYTYDASARLSTILYPSSRKVAYGYDNLDRITSVTNNGAALVSSVAFDDWGNRQGVTFASTSKDEWFADATGAFLDHWNIGYVGGGPETRSYQYDSAENLTQAGEWTLQHDSAGRLTQASGFSLVNNLTHDAFGNNTSSVSTGTVPTSMNNFTFNSLTTNQLPSLTTNGGLTYAGINGRGEATQLGTAVGSGQTLGLAWDGLGRLSSVTQSSTGAKETFWYAPTGFRTKRTDNVDATQNRYFVYTTGGLLLAEYLGTPAWKRDVVYLGSEPIAEIDASGVHELHKDHLGTPRVITVGATGAVEGRQAYGPYGELVQSQGYVPLTGYTGHVQTEPTGLVYMRGRFYSPSWHRFVNSDQGADPATFNQMAYVGGSPLQSTDPSGLAADETSMNPADWTIWGIIEPLDTIPFYRTAGGTGMQFFARGPQFFMPNGRRGGGGSASPAPTPAQRRAACIDQAIADARAAREEARQQQDAVVDASAWSVFSQEANDSMPLVVSASSTAVGFLASEHVNNLQSKAAVGAAVIRVLPHGIDGVAVASSRALGYAGAAMLVGQIFSGASGEYYHYSSEVPTAQRAFLSREDRIERDYNEKVKKCREIK